MIIRVLRGLLALPLGLLVGATIFHSVRPGASGAAVAAGYTYDGRGASVDVIDNASERGPPHAAARDFIPRRRPLAARRFGAPGWTFAGADHPRRHLCQAAPAGHGGYGYDPGRSSGPCGPLSSAHARPCCRKGSTGEHCVPGTDFSAVITLGNTGATARPEAARGSQRRSMSITRSDLRVRQSSTPLGGPSIALSRR